MTLLVIFAQFAAPAAPAPELLQYRFDFCAGLIFAVVMGVMARKVLGALPRLESRLRFAAIVGLIVGGAWAFAACAPDKPFELACVALVAVVAAEVAVIATAALLVPSLLLYDRREKAFKDFLEHEQLREGIEHRRKQEERTQERHELEMSQKKAEIEQQQPKPPPSQGEVFAAAKKRFDETLRMLESAGLDDIELEAGRERAKQKFLKDIDGVM